jgi:hypothetical protein
LRLNDLRLQLPMSNPKNGARYNTNRVLELVDEGVVDKDAMIRDLLLWMSESEVAEFVKQQELFDDEDEDEDEEDEDEEDEDLYRYDSFLFKPSHQ